MGANIATSMVIYAALFFVAGWGWGQWWAERNMRKERTALEAGRILVSMPANAEDAANSLEMLRDIVRRAEFERGTTDANRPAMKRPLMKFKPGDWTNT